MGAFDVEAPSWGRIPPVTVTGAPVANADGSVTIATDAGTLRVALLDCGARLRLGPDTRDYGVLLSEPATLAALDRFARALAEGWRPHRGAAAIFTWHYYATGFEAI
jgi:hypothetical protein